MREREGGRENVHSSRIRETERQRERQTDSQTDRGSYAHSLLQVPVVGH